MIHIHVSVPTAPVRLPASNWWQLFLLLALCIVTMVPSASGVKKARPSLRTCGRAEGGTAVKRGHASSCRCLHHRYIFR